jgi:hypothetical protein
VSARTAYLDALARELKAARVPARRRARILVELADHLREDPRAQMGAPDELASEFARLVDASLTRIWRGRLRAAAVMLLVPAAIELAAAAAGLASGNRALAGESPPLIVDLVMSSGVVLAGLCGLLMDATARRRRPPDESPPRSGLRRDLCFAAAAGSGLCSQGALLALVPRHLLALAVLPWLVALLLVVLGVWPALFRSARIARAAS